MTQWATTNDHNNYHSFLRGGQTVKLCHIFIGIRQPGTDLQSERTQFPGMLSIFIAVHLYDVMANEAIKVNGQQVTTVIILPLDDTVVSDKFMTFIWANSSCLHGLAAVLTFHMVMTISVSHFNSHDRSAPLWCFFLPIHLAQAPARPRACIPVLN